VLLAGHEVQLKVEPARRQCSHTLNAGVGPVMCCRRTKQPSKQPGAKVIVRCDHDRWELTGVTTRVLLCIEQHPLDASLWSQPFYCTIPCTVQLPIGHSNSSSSHSPAAMLDSTGQVECARARRHPAAQRCARLVTHAAPQVACPPYLLNHRLQPVPGIHCDLQ
jgi:hypothetical protein